MTMRNDASKDIALYIHDATYPPALRMLPDAPPVLHLLGHWPFHLSPVVGIVGARAASRQGMHLATHLAADLAKQGALIISGGACGIDAAAHRGVLLVAAPTVVVLGTGLDNPYPRRHWPLFAEVLSYNGGLLTPYARGFPVKRWHFLRRNRVIAGLADVLVVVEGSLHSGALSTARAAWEYGRILCAYPGSPGTDALLAQGAVPIKSATDVLHALKGSLSHPWQPAQLPLLHPDEAIVWNALSKQDPQAHDADSLGEKTGLDSLRVAKALLALELGGLLLPLPGGRYTRLSHVSTS